jgi:hypothetical protein
MTFSLRPRMSFVPVAGVLLSLMLATACQPPRTTWKDIPPAPSGAPYEGKAEKVLDERLASRISERNLKLLDSRLEQLPLDVTFAQHVTWRGANNNDMRQVSERVPEPDAPVMLTALTAPR